MYIYSEENNQSNLQDLNQWLAVTQGRVAVKMLDTKNILVFLLVRFVALMSVDRQIRQEFYKANKFYVPITLIYSI